MPRSRASWIRSPAVRVVIVCLLASTASARSPVMSSSSSRLVASVFSYISSSSRSRSSSRKMGSSDRVQMRMLLSWLAVTMKSPVRATVMAQISP